MMTFLQTVGRAISSGGFLQQLQLELPAIRNGTGLVPGFKDLAQSNTREKNHGIFLLSGMQGRVTYVEEDRFPSGRWGTVLFPRMPKGNRQVPWDCLMAERKIVGP